MPPPRFEPGIVPHGSAGRGKPRPYKGLKSLINRV
jgi:hypothetical protein